MYFFALSETSTDISLTSIITCGSPHLCHPGLLGGSARRQQPPALSKPLRCYLTTWVGSKQPLGTAEAHSSFLGPCSSPPAFGTDSLTAATLQTGRNMPGGTRSDKLCKLTSLPQLWKSNGEKKNNQRKQKPLNWILFEWIYMCLVAPVVSPPQEASSWSSDGAHPCIRQLEVASVSLSL